MPMIPGRWVVAGSRQDPLFPPQRLFHHRGVVAQRRQQGGALVGVQSVNPVSELAHDIPPGGFGLAVLLGPLSFQLLMNPHECPQA